MSKLQVAWSKDGYKTDPYVLNLDEKFNSFSKETFVYGLQFKRLTFRGGEPHFQITTTVSYIGPLFITQRFNTIGDLFDVLLAVDAAKRIGFTDISLVMPYFPAARQDRVCNMGEPLTVKVMADLINQCGFKHVHILKPHSEVTPALIDNVVLMDEYKYVRNIVNGNLNGHQFNIVCPDAGAGKWTMKLAQALAYDNGYVAFNLIRCEKIRDVSTGELKDFFVLSDDLGGYPTLICDDINSMGGTFIGLGKKLREKKCGKLMLFTVHSDCSEGVERVCEFFDDVYTTNSKKDWDELNLPNLKCLKIEL